MNDYWTTPDGIAEAKRNQLCRDGKLPCVDCGKPTEMYYEPICFHCKKPGLEDRDTLNTIVKAYNLVMALNWLSNNEPNFEEANLWNQIVDQVPGNDQCFVMECEDSKDMRLLLKHYPDGNGHVWWVSW